MQVSKEIGIDRDVMQKLPIDVVKRQLFIFNSISLTLIVIGLMTSVSGTIYSLIIFHSWLISIGVGIFIGAVVYNLYRLFLMTGLDLKGSSLAYYHMKHENHYVENNLYSLDGSAYQHADEVLKGWAVEAKDKLRSKVSVNSNHPRNVFTVSVRVFVIALIAVIFANGLEILIFSQPINMALSGLRQSLPTEDWTYKYILTAQVDEPFILIDANSLLLTFDALDSGLGKWKTLMDIIVFIIYMIPLIVIYRSKEIRHGAYVQEQALHEINKTTYHYLRTQKYCYGVFTEVKEMEIPFNKYENRLITVAETTLA